MKDIHNVKITSSSSFFVPLFPPAVFSSCFWLCAPATTYPTAQLLQVSCIDALCPLLVLQTLYFFFSDYYFSSLYLWFPFSHWKSKNILESMLSNGIPKAPGCNQPSTFSEFAEGLKELGKGHFIIQQLCAGQVDMNKCLKGVCLSRRGANPGRTWQFD